MLSKIKYLLAVGLLSLLLPDMALAANPTTVVTVQTLASITGANWINYPYLWVLGGSSVNDGHGGLFNKVVSCTPDSVTCVQDSAGHYFKFSLGFGDLAKTGTTAYLVSGNNVTGAANGKCLQVDASGNIAPTAASCASGGSGSPGAPTTSIQRNNAGAFAGSSTLTADDTHLSIGASVCTLSPLFIGDTCLSNSINAMVLINRNLTGSAATNYHGYSDSSTYNLAANTGANSFDSRVLIAGSNHIDHYAGFQGTPVYSGTGIIDNIYGGYFSPSVNFGGTAGNQYGIYIAPPGNNGTLTGDSASIGIGSDGVGRRTKYFAINSATLNPAKFSGPIFAGIIGQADAETDPAVYQYIGVKTPNLIVDGPALFTLAHGQGAFWSGGTVGDTTNGLTMAGYGDTTDLRLYANTTLVMSVAHGGTTAAFASALKVAGVIGVNCASGVTAGTVVVTGGIVTHC